MSKHISKRTHLNSVHRQMTIKIPRKEGERKIKWQPLAVETERRKEQTFSRRWVRTCPEGFIISHWGERGGNRVHLYFTVFLLHVLLLLMTIAAVVGCNFKQIQSLLWCDIIHLKVHLYIFYYFYFFMIWIWQLYRLFVLLIINLLYFRTLKLTLKQFYKKNI